MRNIVYRPDLGDSLNLLDTPSMLIDLNLMEMNIARMMERFIGSGVGVRPHLKTVKCPAIANKLIEAGAIGGCVSKVSEGEVMAEGGIEDILITSEIIGKPKVARLVELVQKHPEVKVVIDSFIGAR